MFYTAAVSELLRWMFNMKSTQKQARKWPASGTATAEKIWAHLQRRQILGKKFRRQEGIGPYIVDFYCPECRVIVELDGAPHFEADEQEYDAERTNYLEELGMKVIRFENRTLYEDTERVLETI